MVGEVNFFLQNKNNILAGGSFCRSRSATTNWVQVTDLCSRLTLPPRRGGQQQLHMPTPRVIGLQHPLLQRPQVANHLSNHAFVHPVHLKRHVGGHCNRLIIINNVHQCRMPSSGMLHHMALIRTDVSEERISSIIKVTRVDEIGTTLVVTGKRRTLRR
jgi:hypothetical protein